MYIRSEGSLQGVRSRRATSSPESAIVTTSKSVGGHFGTWNRCINLKADARHIIGGTRSIDVSVRTGYIEGIINNTSDVVGHVDGRSQRTSRSSDGHAITSKSGRSISRGDARHIHSGANRWVLARSTRHGICITRRAEGKVDVQSWVVDGTRVIEVGGRDIVSVVANGRL